MINMLNMQEGVQLRVADKMEREYRECFHKGDVITVDKAPADSQGIAPLILQCRMGGFHFLADFIVNEEGDIEGFDVIKH
jgi:hypothetical protein